MMGLLFDHIAYMLWQKSNPLFDVLKKCTVFEVSDCADLICGLLKSEENQSNLGKIPKKPPFDWCWLEYKAVGSIESESDHQTRSTNAILFFRQPASFTKPPQIVQDDICLTEHWESYCFSRLDGVAPGEPKHNVGATAIFPKAWVLRFSPCYRLHNIGQTGLTEQHRIGLGGFPMLCGNQIEVPLPMVAILFFGVLNCRNISTELIRGVPQKPREIRHGQPPKTSYHVLRLNLPSTILSHCQAEESEDEKTRMRLHLCRGHFKNLQHDRFKNKGWHWWPAHWKGDPNLGTIDKTYQAREKVVLDSENSLN